VANQKDPKMPTLKDFKRLVRQRMQKTGESYTAARAQLLKMRPKPAAPPVRRAAATKRARPKPDLTRVAPADYAKVAGKSDAILVARTGCRWAKWVKSLDYVQAYEWPHGKIAKHIQDQYGVSDWWSQTVTVGYERIRGLREAGQRMNGAYEASKSRTFPVPVATLYRAFAEAGVRSTWLPRVALTVRKATPNKSMRMAWPDGTSVEVSLIAKDRGKSTAQVQHRKLPDQGSMLKMKTYWTERFDALGKLLTV
jgi:uncharacterized protein YndB with AHSA1/START domain